MPLIVSDISAPEPDLAVVPGSWRDYREHHPTTAPLVVEVADSSLAYDLTTKASLYARPMSENTGSSISLIMFWKCIASLSQ